MLNLFFTGFRLDKFHLTITTTSDMIAVRWVGATGIVTLCYFMKLLSVGGEQLHFLMPGQGKD